MKRRRNEDILRACGERIKFYRLEKGLTQEEISSSLNMDFSQFGKIERGKINITLSTLSDIAVALDVEIHLLISN